MEEKIEILSVELLDRCRPHVNALKRLAQSLRLEFGWHYLLDLTWILSQLGPADGKHIMDAGAGTGVLQWYLAQQGAEVISVDRSSRAALPLRFRTRFRVQGWRKSDLIPSRKVFRENFSRKTRWSIKLKSQAREVIGLARPPTGAGRVFIYNHDLLDLPDIQDNSLDAVVAVSALEHNPPADLEKVTGELLRVLKPGGVLVASLNAARDQDWWHAPSSGWCYTDASLRRIFGLSADVPSNYDCYDQLFSTLLNCTELREGLAQFYFRSGNNGMPWGKWDPKYQPVGVLKIKKG